MWTSALFRFLLATLCLFLCFGASGCGPQRLPEKEFVERLSQVFPESEQGRFSMLTRAELIEQLGAPDREEKIGGNTEKWTYRFSEGVLVIRFTFLDPHPNADGTPGFQTSLDRIDRN